MNTLGNDRAFVALVCEDVFQLHRPVQLRAADDFRPVRQTHSAQSLNPT